MLINNQPIRSIAGMFLVVCLSTAPFVYGQDNPAGEQETAKPRPLSTQRISESAYGISLLPPEETRIVRQTASEYLMQIIDNAARFKILVSVRQFTQETLLDLERKGLEMDTRAVARIAAERMREIQGFATLVVGDEVHVEVDGRPSVTMYWSAPPPRASKSQLPAGAEPERVVVDAGDGTQRIEELPARMFLGKCFIRITAEHWALIEIEGLEADLPHLKPLFDEVVQSVRIQDAKDLEQQRQQSIQSTIAWRKTLKPKDLLQCIVPRQYFRLLHDQPGGEGMDVGWMMVLQKTESRIGKEGVLIRVESFVEMDGASRRVEAEYFVSADESYEDFYIRSAIQLPKGQNPPEDKPIHAKLTGFRTHSKIDITLQTPEVRVLSFEIAPESYLSQAYLWLLPQLIPMDRPGTYGYYFFDEMETKITYRSDRVVPANGFFGMKTQEEVNREPVLSRFQFDRSMAERRMTDKLRYIPTSQRDLQKRWPTTDPRGVP